MALSILRWGSLLGLAAIAVSCGGNNVDRSASPTVAATIPQGTTIKIDGSSTVYPITDEVSKEFEFSHSSAPKIQVEFSGTGGGFKKFCSGETHINNASRPIETDEVSMCESANISYIEIPVAFDALTIVVHPENDWANDITIEELKTLWQPEAEGNITKWNQVRESWPDRPIRLYGPGTESGTFDYFTSVIVGESGKSRQDYTPSEDDTFLVRSVRNDPDALGYFGYSYYKESNNTIKALAVNNGTQTVFPSNETIKDGTYQPLSRPLFIYVNRDQADTLSVLDEFVNFYLTNARALVNVTGYQALPDSAYSLGLDRFAQRKTGSVFSGQSEPNITIEQLLELEAN